MSKLVLLPPPVVPVPADEVIVVDELVTEGYRDVPLHLIRISNTNRTRFNLESLQQLAESIKEVGIMQPILLRPVAPTAEAPQILEIVAGERRFRAACMAGLRVAPARIKILTDMQAAEIQLLENIQRENPHPLEEAIGFEQLMQKHGHNADQLAAKIKQSRSYVYGRLKLCALSLKARELFLDDIKAFPASTALLIARIPTPELQDKALAEITAPQYNGEPMSVRQAAQHIANRYTLNLASAPFDQKDSKLLAVAGSCVKCPKRTGNQPEIYVDTKSADVCTDPDCFAEKKAAHFQRVIVIANKKGIPVLEGDDADDTLPPNTWSREGEFVMTDHHLSAFDRVAPATGMSGTVEKYLAAEALPAPAKYIKDEDGSVLPVYRREDIQAALEAAGACETIEVREKRAQDERNDLSKEQSKKPTKETARQAEQAAKTKLAEELTAKRVALYRKLRAATQTGLGLEMFREVVKTLVHERPLPDDLIGDVYPFEDRSDEGICAYIDKAEYAQVEMIMLDLLIGECLSVSYWEVDRAEDSPLVDALHAMARLQHIDPLQDHRPHPASADAAPCDKQPQASTEAHNDADVDVALVADTKPRPTLTLKNKEATEEKPTDGPVIKVKKNRAVLSPAAAWPFPTGPDRQKM